MRAVLVLSALLAFAAATSLRQVDATNVITCDSWLACPQEIKCPQGANCEVDCSGQQGCSQKTIYCPDNFGCLIRCNYNVNEQCNESTFIQGSGNAAAFSLLCEGQQACSQGKVSAVCNSPLCQVSCIGSAPETCTQFTCVGSGCPAT